MKEITDTDRLDFIIRTGASLSIEREPHCRCGCCRSWMVNIDGDEYTAYDGDARKIIDEAMEKHK